MAHLKLDQRYAIKAYLKIKSGQNPAYNDAREQALKILDQMTIDEKISMIGGYNYFFTKGCEKFNVPAMYLSDATQGVNIRSHLDDQLEKSLAFPSSIALASTWNKELAANYTKSIGEECRPGEIAVLLGPGMNIYRISQNGRNFEYFGEDPYLAARMIENYVVALQTGRESIVLLKNDQVLPIDKTADLSILLTGEYSDKIPHGGGSAEGVGYDHITMLEAFKEIYGEKEFYIENTTDKEVEAANYVIYSTGTFDFEGWDKSFDVSRKINSENKHIASLNKNTIVVVNSGSGMNMTAWNDDIAGSIYSWYPGQIGFKAFAEITAGITNE